MLDRKIRIEIISPVRNRREITLQCLRSLGRIDKTNLITHTIIVDDGSTDGTADAVGENFPDVEIIHGDGNLWYAGGANRGIERALNYDPDYILLINDDTVFAENFLQAMIDTAQKKKRSVVGGLLLLWNEPHRVFQVAPRWDTWFGGWRHLRQQTVWTIPKEPFEVQLIVGNCTLFPSQVFREAGFFAEYWLPHFGDAEFTPRLRRLGWKLFIEPRARVFNQPNLTPPRLSKMSVKQLYKSLWKNYNDGHNLRNRFVCYWLGAPSRPLALAGFFIFLIRLILRPLGFRNEPGRTDERPLIEEYSRN